MDLFWIKKAGTPLLRERAGESVVLVAAAIIVFGG